MKMGAIRYCLGDSFRRLAFLDHGDAAAPVVMCVPGLTRNAHDFDALAWALAEGATARHRVIAVDLPGRGASDWLDSGTAYAMPSYVAALTNLLAWIDRPVAWVGTSLGGLCGMAVAAIPGAPVTRLVLNDIGPAIPAAALGRIRAYLADAPAEFADLAAAEAHLRRVHAPFGALTDAQWAHLARHSIRALPGGRLAAHYDPRIAETLLAAEPSDVDLWPLWSRIAQPRLVLRGETSDLLLPDTLARMRRDGAETHTVPEAGHAPALMDAPTIARIAAFLGESSPTG